MKTINLLPRTEQKEFKLQIFAGKLMMFWVWVIGSLLVFFAVTLAARIFLSSEGSDALARIDVQKQTLKSSDNELLKQQVEGLNGQIAKIKNLQSQHYNYSEALKDLADTMPLDITLDQISIDRATAKVDIMGVAKSRDSVLKFWSDMHKSEYFKNINFPLDNLNAATDGPFSFSFYLNLAKVKQP